MELKQIILFSLELFILLSAALLSSSYLLYKIKSKKKLKNFSDSESKMKAENTVFDEVFQEVIPASAALRKQFTSSENVLRDRREPVHERHYLYQKPKISVPYNEYSGNRFERV
jgi:hypothetical protein